MLDLCRAQNQFAEAAAIAQKIKATELLLQSGYGIEPLLADLSNTNLNRQRVLSLCNTALDAALQKSESGDYNDAERILSKCSDLADDQTLLKIKCLNARALNFYKQMQFGRAKQLYGQALKLEEKFLDAGDPTYAHTLVQLGKLGSETQLIPLRQAESYLLCALAIYIKIFGAESSQVAQTRMYLSTLYFKSDRIEDARREARSALDVYQTLAQPSLDEEAKCHLVIGVAGNNAAELKESLMILESTSKKDYSGLAATLLALGRISMPTDHLKAEFPFKTRQRYQFEIRCATTSTNGRRNFSIAERKKLTFTSRAEQILSLLLGAHPKWLRISLYA